MRLIYYSRQAVVCNLDSQEFIKGFAALGK
jgi:hypothetical protein